MKLTEILHTLESEKKTNLVNVDSWRWADVDHLLTMGFEPEGDYYLKLKNPKMTIYRENAPEGKIYILNDEDKGKKTFKNFEGVLNYFNHYDQPELKPELGED